MPKQRGAKRQTNDAHSDNITVRNITKSTGVAIGRGAQAKVTQTTGATAEEIAKAFAAITAKVNALPDGPDKNVAASAVEALQDEAKKGEKASDANVRKWFNFLAQSAPDAFDVAVATFANPIAGLGLAFRKIAERAKEDRQGES